MGKRAGCLKINQFECLVDLWSYPVFVGIGHADQPPSPPDEIKRLSKINHEWKICW
jgi:hypothetical protein